MKRFMQFTLFVVGLLAGLIGVAVYYMGAENVIGIVWAITVLGAYALGRVHTRSDMVHGATVAVKAQESDDSRDREGLKTLTELLKTMGVVNNLPAPGQAQLPDGNGMVITIPDDELEFEDADFKFDDAE